MRKFILLCLFVMGITLAVLGFVNFQGLATKGEFQTILLDFREDIPATVIQQDLQAIAQKYQVTPQLDNQFSAKDNVYIIKGDKQRLQELKHSPLDSATEYIEPNYIYKTKPNHTVPTTNDQPNTNLTGPNDQFYSKQWNLHKIGIEAAWTHSKGNGITVAVIDTGITKVRDLYDTKMVKGYDFVNDREEATDDNGHGTHVAGTVAQTTNNQYGVAGVAYEASLMPLKVLNADGAGTVADIAEAIKFAADNGADIINMSLGGGGESQLMKEAINYAHSKGVTIIAAAGNESADGVSYPARYAHVIGVSAFGPDGEKASYSNYGAGVDISAPGGSEAGAILQETIGENGEGVFLGLQGTSMASPHVAGVAALIKATGVKEPEEILQILKQSARVIPDDSLNYYGAGQLNAEAAVKLATEGKISFPDFFRWLRDNGYLNPRFWIDGGVVALVPKLLMVIGSYLLAWFLRVYFPFTWSWSLSTGLIFGSSGLFFLKGFYIYDIPQWPFRVLGSSLPELGNAVQGTDAFNPIFASVIIPFILIALLLGHPQGKWFAIGSTVGVTACLSVSAIYDPAVWGLGNSILARSFLLVNAILCYLLASLALRNEEKTA
ncbi:peptidase S8 [Anabaena sp. FACHB-1237]|uniref:S8 family peptidase n=1 Tax=Anabaena sp. FACHB-1237 TaxID=2692769 RepID=UPI0016818A08|nr:S8 family peptidase [Anabaena sp. FACHB-1237]MBD2138970.1 peptidase S8 [Anabaena sp. FACHB-1237]